MRVPIEKAVMVLAVGYKMLKFDSFDPTGAQAAGLPVRLSPIEFLLLLAIDVAEAVQIVGALLVFALMTIPAATARYYTVSFKKILVSSDRFSGFQPVRLILVGVGFSMALSGAMI